MGWGWVDHRGSRSDAGGASNGTNQIGELCAVLQALRAHRGSQDLIIESDSQYAINCSTKWVHGWKKNGWKNSKKQSVKNAPLIKAIDAELSGRSGSVKFKWVKGHAGNEFNEKVDDLAHGYATHIGQGHEQGYLPFEGWQSLLDSPYAEGVDIPAEVQLVLEGKQPPEILDYADARDDDSVIGHGDADQSSSESSQHEIPEISKSEGIRESHSKSHHENDGLGEVLNASETGSEAIEPETSQSQKLLKSTPEQSPVEQSHLESARQPDARRKPQLRASGKIRLSPPPSSSKRYNGVSLRVCGTLQIDAPIDADGYVDLEGSIFTMEWFSTDDQRKA
jgi:ribonuclease HI